MKQCSLCKKPLKKSGVYCRCLGCGHDYFDGLPVDREMVNEKLDKDKVNPGWLDREKVKLVKIVDKRRSGLVDIGSAAGTFLFAAGREYKNRLGVELTKQSREFSIKNFGLKVFKSVGEISFKGVSAVTFWHSLEHIPFGKDVDTVFDKIGREAEDEVRVIISVPNNRFWLDRLARENNTYYDSSSHFHQYSPESLVLFMSRYNFVPENWHFILPYSFFGYLQTGLNMVFRPRNFWYFVQKRGREFFGSKTKTKWLWWLNVLTMVVLSPMALLGSGFDFIAKKKATVMTVSFKRGGKNK